MAKNTYFTIREKKKNIRIVKKLIPFHKKNRSRLTLTNMKKLHNFNLTEQNKLTYVRASTQNRIDIS